MLFDCVYDQISDEMSAH